MSREFTKDPIWLVLGLGNNGLELLSVDTQYWIADRHRRMVETSIEWGGRKLIRVWVEERETNHLYGMSMIDKDQLSVMFTTEELRLLGWDEGLLRRLGRVE